MFHSSEFSTVSGREPLFIRPTLIKLQNKLNLQTQAYLLQIRLHSPI
jgi:hypothetical protein